MDFHYCSPKQTGNPTCEQVKITSPTNNNIIALTDGAYLKPQPGPNGRRPAHRTLTVTGTAPQSASDVTVNHVEAPVVNGAWTAQIPADQTGQLTVKASAQGKDDSIRITLIDLKITSPAENAQKPLGAEPALPTIDGRVTVKGYAQDTSAVTFKWTLQTRGRYVTSIIVNGNHAPQWHSYDETMAHGTTTGTASAWNPQDGTLVGGVGRLIVSARLPGVLDNPITSDPRWIDIPGTNPDVAVAKAFVDQHEAIYAGLVRHIIFCWESLRTWHQFATHADQREGRSDNIPADWAPNPAPRRPLYGPPAGIGIAQVDPAAFPAQQWNWQTNLLGGLAVFHQKLTSARGWAGREQQRLDHRRQAALAAAHQPANAVPRLIVPALTDVQLQRETVRLYNGNHQFRFDADYIVRVGPGGPAVVIVGTRQWVESPGHWRTPANLVQPSQWVPAANPNYVNQVLGCANS